MFFVEDTKSPLCLTPDFFIFKLMEFEIFETFPGHCEHGNYVKKKLNCIWKG